MENGTGECRAIFQYIPMGGYTVKMKLIWILALSVSVITLLWFLLGITGNFQRMSGGLGMIVILPAIWAPAVIFTIISTILLKKHWYCVENKGSVGLILAIVAVSVGILLAPMVDIRGWLVPKIDIEKLKTTSDSQYEYQVELINKFQKNSSMRLYVKNASTLKEVRIPLDYNTRDISGFSGDGWGESGKTYPNWSTMEETDDPVKYILIVYGFHELSTKFEIDVEVGTSKKME